MRITRRATLLLPLLAAGCGGLMSSSSEPVNYPPLAFDYLDKIRIDVGRVEIDDNWVPRGAGKHIEYMAPTLPRVALATMARDRLFPAGSKGMASFVVEDASIIRATATYEASFAVRLDVVDEGGNRLGTASARVTMARPIDGDSPARVRSALYDLVRDAMRDMNVEFEFQVKKALKNMLQATDAVVQEGPKVQTEDLTAPAPGAPGSGPKPLPLKLPPQ